jgi:glycolate oxidase FAD binding subunit
VNPALSSWLRQQPTGSQGAEGWSLLVGFDGTEQAVTRQIRDFQAICQHSAGLAYWSGADDGSLWGSLLSRFNIGAANRLDHVVVRVGTVRTHVMATLTTLLQLESSLPDPIEVTVRYGTGIIYARIPLTADAVQSTALGAALANIRAQLATMRSYMVAESAPPSVKASFDCWGDLGPQVEVMRGLKAAFDPRRVLNPGRFVNGI